MRMVSPDFDHRLISGLLDFLLMAVLDILMQWAFASPNVAKVLVACDVRRTDIARMQVSNYDIALLDLYT